MLGGKSALLYEYFESSEFNNDEQQRKSNRVA